MIDCLISTGKSGVARMALDYCKIVGMPCGGWTNEDYILDDGCLADKYQRILLPVKKQSAIEKNVIDADATIIFAYYHGDLIGDELLTMRHCIRHKKDLFVFELSDDIDVMRRQVGPAAEFLLAAHVEVLNVVGSAESDFHGKLRKIAGTALEGVLASAFLYLQEHPELQPNPNRFAEKSWKDWHANDFADARCCPRRSGGFWSRLFG